jgi:hypothetical protein
MRLEQAAHGTFANHQTFHPRFGWVKKAYDGAVDDPRIFTEPDATVRLGVGKNMVDAIRFWGTALNVIARHPDPDRPRIGIAQPTVLGNALLDDEHGWDPYLENVATLWVLHWHAVSAVTHLPVWWAIFNDLTALEFTEDDLVRFAVDEVAATTWAQPTEGSIGKDVDCLLRMYAPRKTTKGRQTLDDLLDSPFREVGLVVPAPGDRDAYRFIRGPKPTLPPEVVVYACLDYLARTDPDARTATVTRLTADSGSPGRLLKLTEDVVLEATEKVATSEPRLTVASPAGATQLVFDGDPAEIATVVLHRYYASKRPDLPASDRLVAGPTARSTPPGSEALVVANVEAPRRTSRARSTKGDVLKRLEEAQRRIDGEQTARGSRRRGAR